jgi:hypothetical protein
MVQFIDIMPHIMLHRATYHVTVFMIGNCTDHIITYGSSLSSFVQLLSHFCPVAEYQFGEAERLGKSTPESVTCIS